MQNQQIKAVDSHKHLSLYFFQRRVLASPDQIHQSQSLDMNQHNKKT